MTMPKKNTLVIVVGPTAVGKTEFSIAVAKAINGEIISADSQQFYRELNIGTAKPDAQEMDGIPHHLVSVTDLRNPWSIAVFKSAVYRLVDEICSRHKVPIMVGGTGQYVRGTIENWTIPEFRKDEQFRKAIEKWGDEIGAQELHARLAIVDPHAARMIDHRNMRRTIRALEVTLRTGIPFSAQRNKSIAPFDTIMVGIIRPREELYKRVDLRIEKMIANGFIEEVESLLAAGLEPELLRANPLGYTEMVDYIKRNCSLEDAIAAIKKRTRILVRRQANWFKPDDVRIRWFSVNENTERDLIDYIQLKMK